MQESELEVRASDTTSARTRWFPAAVVILGTVGLTVLVLRAQGRLWSCACGEIYIWAGDIWSPHNSQHLFDPYTLTHLLHGVILAWVLGGGAPKLRQEWQITLATMLESGWEVIENSNLVIQRYRTATISLGYVGDTVLNSVGDILICGLGFALARYLGGWRSAGLFVLTEVLLILWIRDSLLLNVLMLFYSPEGLRSWQMGG